ncbi:MAG: hypothetical protein DWQ19_09560 [Crenarchaeota archaeon]|nr:MAG: hypothetical protein DWQ19_09560 [Thermoproteota archaeon]
MTELNNLEKQLAQSLGKIYRYYNILHDMGKVSEQDKIELAQRILREQDLGVFGAQAEYQKWMEKRND